MRIGIAFILILSLLAPAALHAVVPAEGGGGPSLDALRNDLQTQRAKLKEFETARGKLVAQQKTNLAGIAALEKQLADEPRPTARAAIARKMADLKRANGAVTISINSVQSSMSSTTARIQDLERRIAAASSTGGGSDPTPPSSDTTGTNTSTTERSGDISAPTPGEGKPPPEDFSKILEGVYRVTDGKKQRVIFAYHEKYAKGWRTKHGKLTLPVRVANAVTGYVALKGDRLGFVSKDLLEARSNPEALKGKKTTVRRAAVGIRKRPFGAWKAVTNPKKTLQFTGKYNGGWFEVLDGEVSGWVPIIWLRGPGAAPEPDDDENAPGEKDEPENRADDGKD